MFQEASNDVYTIAAGGSFSAMPQITGRRDVLQRTLLNLGRREMGIRNCTSIGVRRYPPRARYQSPTKFANALATRIANTGTVAMANASAAGDEASRFSKCGDRCIGRTSLSGKRIRSTSISSSFKGIILTCTLKFHDLRHLVLATRALIGALVVTGSVRKDADQ
jgi:hypothetical protein